MKKKIVEMQKERGKRAQDKEERRATLARANENLANSANSPEVIASQRGDAKAAGEPRGSPAVG